LADKIENKYCPPHDEKPEPNNTPSTSTQTPRQTIKPTKTMDEELTPDDVIDVVRELFSVRGKSEILGRVLGLDRGTVRAIHCQYSDPTDCLYRVIEEVYKCAEPRLTWRLTLATLRDPLIGEHCLASDIEKKYFPTDHDGNGSEPLTATPTTHSLQKAEPTRAIDETLTPYDAIDVAHELLALRGRTEIFGRLLRLPKYVVDSIHSQYSDSQRRLLRVIDEFVNDVIPRHTWGVILAALRSPLIGELSLAEEIDTKYVSPPSPSAHTPLPQTAKLMDDILSPDDVPDIVEEMLDMCTKSKNLGLLLGVPRHTLDSIHRQYSNPIDHLFHIIDEFVTGVERPTWRDIVKALRSPLLNLSPLAEEMEENFLVQLHQLQKQQEMKGLIKMIL
jgi:hypothetical protein